MAAARMLVVTVLAVVAGDAHAEPAAQATAAATATARDETITEEAPDPVSARRPAFGAGYFRGAGLGYFGASLALAWKPQVTPQLHVFGFFDDGSRGFAVVPAVRLSLRQGPRSSPFVSGGLQYLRLWFGDVAGGGFGGYGTVGYALRFLAGFELELGVGLHLKQAIRGSDGPVSVEQRATFGPHWDAGLRYWF